MMSENELLEDESLEQNVVIWQKNLQVSTHCIRWIKLNEKPQYWQCVAKGSWEKVSLLSFAPVNTIANVESLFIAFLSTIST